MNLFWFARDLRILEDRLLLLSPWDLAEFVAQHSVVVSVLQDGPRKRLISSMLGRLGAAIVKKAA
jgi:hypothetical protein